MIKQKNNFTELYYMRVVVKAVSELRDFASMFSGVQEFSQWFIMIIDECIGDWCKNKSPEISDKFRYFVYSQIITHCLGKLIQMNPISNVKEVIVSLASKLPEVKVESVSTQSGVSESRDAEQY